MGAENLATYLKSRRNRDFKLGEHDCFTFTNGAWQTMYGSGYADQFVGKYADLGPRQFVKLMKAEFGHAKLLDALDHGLTRVSGFPPKGALVVTKSARPYFTGYALGIACGVNAVFLGDTDLTYMPITQIDGAWICHR